MKKIIIPILLLAAFLTPSCIPGSTGKQPEQIEIGKTITTGTTGMYKYRVSEFSYCGRRYLIVEADKPGRFEVVPIL